MRDLLRRRWSLAARLTAWYAGTAFLLVAGAGLVQYRTLRDDLASEDDRLVTEMLAATQRGSVVSAVPAAASAQDASLGPLVRELDADCRVQRGVWPVHAPPPSCPRKGLSPDARLLSEAALRTWRSPTGRTWRIATGPPDSTGQRLEVALDRWTDERVLADYRKQLIAVLGAALVVSAGLGYALARRGLAPLMILSRRMAVVDARSLDPRLDPIPDAPAEVQALVASFDTMLVRLDGAFAALSRFSAELAHEFRTPLHVLRQHAEVALSQPRTAAEYREILGSSLEEIERLRRLVDDTLFLARAEDPREAILRTPLNAGAELRDIAEYLEALATESGVELVADARGGLVVLADRALFRRAVVNLVTNALRHTPRGGHVTLTAMADGGQCSAAASRERPTEGTAVHVRDTGPGIAPADLARVFERYYRAHDAQAQGGGAGLGLAIVQGIMQMHGGTAVVESALGRGTCVTLRFPPAAH